jgi:hypothetical protein
MEISSLSAASATSQSVTIYLALELSRASWVVAVPTPLADKIGLHRLQGGASEALLALIARLQARVEAALGCLVAVVSCHEAGYDGLLAASAARSPWHSQPCPRSGEPAGRSPGQASQNRPDRCGEPAARPDGALARRAQGGQRGAGAERGRGGLPGSQRRRGVGAERQETAAPRAAPAGRRAHPARQSHQGAAGEPGHL